uniref:PKD domain-containing protein n=1 Tax=candidate division WOR-3 bacterium TaxID=2052148 RepID=A0A7C3YT24_UNCW3
MSILLLSFFLFASHEGVFNLKKIPLLGDTVEDVVFSLSLLRPDTCVYEIFFGDGERFHTSFLSTEYEVSHKFSLPGKYWVKLFAHSKKGFSYPPESILIEIRDNLFSRSIPLPSATISSPACDLKGNNFYLGLEDNALLSFRSDGTLRFSFQTKNSVYATPSVFGDRVFFGSLDSNLYCLDTSGNLLWSYKVSGEIYQAIATNGSFLVAVSDDGHIFCFSLSGKLLWEKRIGPEPSPPTIDEKGNIFLTADGVYGFSPKGKLLFFFQTSEKSLFTTGCVLSSDGSILTGNEDGYLYCLNKNGELLWKAPTPEEDPIRCEGIFYLDTFLFGCDDGTLYKKGRYGGLVPFWTTDGEIISSPVVSEDGFFFFFSDDGYLYCVRQDGQFVFKKEIAYSEKGFYITPSLLLTPDGILVATSWDEMVYLFDTKSLSVYCCPPSVDRGPASHGKRIWHTYRGNSCRTGCLYPLSVIR